MKRPNRIGIWLTLACVGVGVAGCSDGMPREGAMAPDVALELLGDKTKDLQVSDLKGKVVILDFWATWCGPCRQAMPHLVEMQQKYRDQGLVVVAVSDEDRDTISAFVKKTGYSLGFYRDPFRLANQKYMVDGYPTTFVIDRSGRITSFSQGGDPAPVEAAVKAAL